MNAFKRSKLSFLEYHLYDNEPRNKRAERAQLLAIAQSKHYDPVLAHIWIGLANRTKSEPLP